MAKSIAVDRADNHFRGTVKALLYRGGDAIYSRAGRGRRLQALLPNTASGRPRGSRRRERRGGLAARRRAFPHGLMQPRLSGKWLVSAPPLAYLLFFFAAPLAIMALASFRAPGDFGGLAPLMLRDDEGGTHLNLTAEAYAVLFPDFLYGWLFLKSLGCAALATVLCLAAGYPLALLIARSPRGTATSSCCW